MESYTIHVMNRPEGVPKEFSLFAIPRLNEEIDFGTGKKYLIGRLVWSAVPNAQMVSVRLTELDDYGDPVKP